VIHKYVPRWLAFTAIYGFMGAAGAVWFDVRKPWRLALFAALLGWLTTHFDVTFDEDKLVQERDKNARLRSAAKRLFPFGKSGQVTPGEKRSFPGGNTSAGNTAGNK